MKLRIVIVSALAAVLYLFTEFLWAADPTPTQLNTQIQDQDQIYGYELLTPTERVEFRSRMRSARTLEERNQIRNENHKAMSERAASRGMVLPDGPRSRGTGRGQGRGMGSGGGMGQGGGMGSGGGMGQGGGNGR